MGEPQDNKFEKYWDIFLMFCYFCIPFVGMQKALKTHTATDSLPVMTTVLLVLAGCNIATWMILLLDGKTLLVKSVWTGLLAVTMVVLNLVVM